MNSLDDLELELRKLPGVKAAGFDEREDVLLIQLHVGDERADQPVPMSASRIASRHSDRPVAVEVVRWRTPRKEAPVERDVPAPNGEDADADAVVSGSDVDADADAVVSSSAGEYAEPAPNEEEFIDLTPEPAPAETETRRARLLAVLAFPDTDELEVHLILEGRRTIGRAPASRGLVGAVEATIDAVRGLGAAIEPHARWAKSLDGGDEDRSLVAVAIGGIEEDETATDFGLASGASPIDAAARSTLDALNRRLARLL